MLLKRMEGLELNALKVKNLDPIDLDRHKKRERERRFKLGQKDYTSKLMPRDLFLSSVADIPSSDNDSGDGST